MIQYKKIIALAFATLLFQNTAVAETKYEVEIDPSTFALNGYAFHARILPESMPKWRLGAGVYSMDFPDIFIDMNSKNKGLGWNVTLDQGIGLFAEYFFKTREKGWYVGTQVAQQTYVISNDSTGALSSEFKTILVIPYVGHRWQLTDNIYAQGWFGLGAANKTSGDTQVGTNTFDVAPELAFGALHIGYRF